MLGWRPLAGRALGAHISPRRVGQRAPGAATKGRTERPNSSSHSTRRRSSTWALLVGMEELETEAAVPFCAKAAVAKRNPNPPAKRVVASRSGRACVAVPARAARPPAYRRDERGGRSRPAKGFPRQPRNPEAVRSPPRASSQPKLRELCRAEASGIQDPLDQLDPGHRLLLSDYNRSINGQIYNR